MCGLLLCLAVVTHVPAVQREIAGGVASALEQTLGTRVRIGRVDLGLLRRVIIDDVEVYDLSGKRMLAATRLSARVDLLPLTRGKISVSSAQLFGLRAQLYRQRAGAKPNFQFVLDRLASKDTTQHKPLDLAIHSLVVRGGSVSWDQWDVPASRKFSTAHLRVGDISTHIMLPRLTDDSLSLFVKHLSLREQSGLELRGLTFSLVADRSHLSLRDFHLTLPHSLLSIPAADATYRFSAGRLERATLQYAAALGDSYVTPADLACFLPALHGLDTPVYLGAAVRGTSTSLSLRDLTVRAEGLTLVASGSASGWDATMGWAATVSTLDIRHEPLAMYASRLGVALPPVVSRLGDIRFRGQAGGRGADITAKGRLDTGAGSVSLVAGSTRHGASARVETRGVNLRELLDDPHLGLVAASLRVDAAGRWGHWRNAQAEGAIASLDYDGYTYRDILLNAALKGNALSGHLHMDDPNAQVALDFEGIKGTRGARGVSSPHLARMSLAVRGLNPQTLHLTGKWPDTQFDFDLHADVSGSTLASAQGEITLSDLHMRSPKDDYRCATLALHATGSGEGRQLTAEGDFGRVEIDGRIDYASLPRTVSNVVAHYLPSIPGGPRAGRPTANAFTVNAHIADASIVQHLLGIPLTLQRPLTVEGRIDDATHTLDLNLHAPMLAYGGKEYRRCQVMLRPTEGGELAARVHLGQMQDGRRSTYWNVEAETREGRLDTQVSFENSLKGTFQGVLRAEAACYEREDGTAAVHVAVSPSHINIADTLWQVGAADIHYYKDHLLVDHFSVSHGPQHIVVSGAATPAATDTLTADLSGVDVSYILNLVNFHSVEFGGRATGYAYLSGAFSGQPEASANLMVSGFTFEGGRMGMLAAQVSLNNEQQQLDIDATAYDGDHARTDIRGYVSPKRNYIDLSIGAHHTRGEFLESFCGSFAENIDVYADGDIRIAGDLKRINMTGHATVDGSLRISSLGTTYRLHHAPVTMIPDEIRLEGDSIFDRDGRHAIVTGSLYHKHLTRLSYDIGIRTAGLLSYDFADYGDNTFYGTVYTTGRCTVRGKSGEVTIDASLRPERGSFIEYNAASPDAITTQSFVEWHDRVQRPAATTAEGETEETLAARDGEGGEAERESRSDIRINLLVDCTPESALRVLMDRDTGDRITLHGNGTIRASYFNKGDFQMFGTYAVESGTYRLTIQNVIRRDFQFQPGGSIAFGGNSMNAALNLKAQYTVPAVSLSDLNVGRSFTGNNIRVNCLMNITGTPNAPRVDFGLDLPTMSTDARQMVTNLINSEEGMNQQVLYLLAVGRFYPQAAGAVAADGGTRHSQTSLAMQSILSGTLSQQLNNVLGAVVKNNNWNFGANISTGDEGWNNAEYEGTLSGRLLGNRLLFNGQFGYRDNANATTSFIGDFDLRYLIFPNGNLALRVYNQTNDRYFTRNSLNTQGIGIILKKDFSSWRDFIGWRKRRRGHK